MATFPGYSLLNAGRSWSVKLTGSTYRFEVRPGDVTLGDPITKERSEIKLEGLRMTTGHTYDIHYKFMVEPGAQNSDGAIIVGQLHATPDAQDYAATAPPFAIQLIGEHLAIGIRADPNAVTTDSPQGYYIYQDPNAIT